MRQVKHGTCRACDRQVAITNEGRTYNHHNLKNKPCVGRGRLCKEHPHEQLITRWVEACRKTFFDNDWVIDEGQASEAGTTSYIDTQAAVDLTLPVDPDELFPILTALQETGRYVDAPHGVSFTDVAPIALWLMWLVGLAIKPILDEMEDVAVMELQRQERLRVLLAAPQ